MIFDLLYSDGSSIMGLPYTERRSRLEALGLGGDRWQVPAYHAGDGSALLEASRQQGLEGIVAKRLDSVYEPGKRSGAWRKVKNVLRQEFVIGGWLPGQGGRASTLGSLAVGYYDDGKLVYAGQVGTGFKEPDLKLLMDLLTPLRTDKSPFEGRQPPKQRVSVKPELVAEVEFREWTRSRTLRAPSFKGLRDDKDPKEVVAEFPEG
jgi:bifunctional non-homologous end joining protein LigD